jgi:hypothetical protein
VDWYGVDGDRRLALRRLGERVGMPWLTASRLPELSLLDEICRRAGVSADVRRFRPNVLVRSARAVPFEEDAWVSGTLTFGDGDDAPAVSITMRDPRCVMVNFDPDGAPPAHSRAPHAARPPSRASPRSVQPPAPLRNQPPSPASLAHPFCA